MIVAPWYSTRPGIEVYHNNNKCWDGNNIEPKYKARGTGGKRLCAKCRGLNAMEKRKKR